MNDELDARLAATEKTLELLLTHVEELTNQIAANPAPHSGSSEPPPWLHAEVDESVTRDLGAWVAWFTTNYQPAQPSDQLPACWQQHPGMVAELTTLWHVWQAAFVTPDAAPEAAQNWHDRWLPGMLSRIPRWIPGTCINGRHKPSM